MSRTDGLAWLGELQTHSWRNGSDTIQFLKPWSRGSFSHQQWEELRHILEVYRNHFTWIVQKFTIMLHKGYPLEIQAASSCEAYPENASESFLHVAFQGIHVLSFQGTSWKPEPDAAWLNRAIEDLNKDQNTREMMHSLFNDTCPHFARGLIEAGKSELEQQGQPCKLPALLCAPLYLGFTWAFLHNGLFIHFTRIHEYYILYVMKWMQRTESGSS